MTKPTCVICLLADATDEDYCSRCGKIAAEADADDSVSCADFLRVCQARARRAFRLSPQEVSLEVLVGLARSVA